MPRKRNTLEELEEQEGQESGGEIGESIQWTQPPVDFVASKNPLIDYFSLHDVPPDQYEQISIAVYKSGVWGRSQRIATIPWSEMETIGDPETAVAPYGPGRYTLRPLMSRRGWIGSSKTVEISSEFARQHGWSGESYTPPPPPPAPPAPDPAVQQVAQTSTELTKSFAETLMEILKRDRESKEAEASREKEERNVLLATLLNLLSHRDPQPPPPPPPPPPIDVSALLTAMTTPIQQMAQMMAQHQQMMMEVQKMSMETQMRILQARDRQSGPDLLSLINTVSQLMSRNPSPDPSRQIEAVASAIQRILEISRTISETAAKEPVSEGVNPWQNLLVSIGQSVGPKVIEALLTRPQQPASLPTTEAPPAPAQHQGVAPGSKPPEWMDRFRTQPVIEALSDCDPYAIRLIFIQNMKEALNYSNDPDRVASILADVLPARLLTCLEAEPQRLSVEPADCEFFGLDYQLALAVRDRLLDTVAKQDYEDGEIV